MLDISLDLDLKVVVFFKYADICGPYDILRDGQGGSRCSSVIYLGHILIFSDICEYIEMDKGGRDVVAFYIWTYA